MVLENKRFNSAHASIHSYEINVLIQENNYPSQHTNLVNYRPLSAGGPIVALWIRWVPMRHNLFGVSDTARLKLVSSATET